MKAGQQVRLRYERTVYDWSIDYPIKKQAGAPLGASKFELRFELSEAEQAEFKRATGSTLNTVLPIELTFPAGTYATFRVSKPGKGSAALSKKAEAICRFVSSTLDFAYIPAVRTAEASLSVVNDLVRRELKKLEKDARYTDIQKQLSDLQRPILQGIADRLKRDLTSFLGANLKGVSLTLSEKSRSFGPGKSCRIKIDDGTPTVLERKGDGVQSLVAISLLAGALQESGSDKDIILLIEEPESHLHPKAIHQLREVLSLMGNENQLILTTHCPTLVNRASVGANLIVSKNKATQAKSIEEVRRVLGVRPSDNLQHAALVIVVEGPEDEIALRALLRCQSEKLAAAFSAGTLGFYPLGGASKLSYSLTLLQSFLCNYYCVLDNDSEGRRAFEEAKKTSLASHANTTFVKCVGLPDSEFEDLLSEKVYQDFFRIKYAVDVRYAPFNGKGKWSERIRNGLSKAGKVDAFGNVWPENEEYSDKKRIAELAAADPSNALNPSRAEIIKTLIRALEEALISVGTG